MFNNSFLQYTRESSMSIIQLSGGKKKSLTKF